MGILSAADLPLVLYAGLVTDVYANARGLPAGASPNCQDVTFPPNSARTRPGLLAIPGAANGAKSVNYQRTFRDQFDALNTLIGDSGGSLMKEFPFGSGSFGLVAAQLFPANATWKSATAFGREYIATSDGQHGLGAPRQYDGTNLDRVSQCAPGAAPTPVDANASYVIDPSPNGLSEFAAVAIAASPSGATESGTTVTLTDTGGGKFKDLAPGDLINVAGVAVAGYNGAGLTVLAVTNGGDSVQYTAGTSGLAASGGGTVTVQLATVSSRQAGNDGAAPPVGSLIVISGAGVAGYNGTWPVRASTITPVYSGFQLIGYETSIVVALNVTGLAASGGGSYVQGGSVSAGAHMVTVFFVTRQGYWTKFAAPVKWTAAGGLQASLTGIPVGPPNVVARGLAFTAAGGSNFYHIPATMLINDNTTTSLTIDFDDTTLLSGTSVDYLLTLIELGEVASFFEDAGRLWALGERNRLTNVNNLTFDGGFSGNVPLGWTAGDANGLFNAGGAPDTANADWGFGYQITADGVTVERGAINQSVAQWAIGDPWSRAFGFPVPILKPNVGYSVRARVKASAALTAGTFRINVYSPSTGFLATGLAVPALTASTAYQEFIAVIVPPNTAIPSDAAFQVYADGTPGPSGQYFEVDSISIFPTNQPFNTGIVRVSLADDPESFDGLTGLIQPEAGNQDIRALLAIRNLDYMVAESKGIFVTSDDGVNEPAQWQVDTISEVVGTPSVNGVAMGEDWALIVARSGLWIFSGREPLKVSEEIQPTWDTVNWLFGYTSWIEIDAAERRALIGLPFGSAQSPNKALNFEWRELDSAELIAENPPIHVTMFGTSKVLPKSRKWCPWNVAAGCAAMLERGDGTLRLFLGNATSNGKIYQVTPSVSGFAAVTQGSTAGQFAAGYGIGVYAGEAIYLAGVAYALATVNQATGAFTLTANYAAASGTVAFTAIQDTDDGVAILTFYWTHFFPDALEQVQTLAQRLQTNANRWQMSELIAFAEGAGNLVLSVQPPGNAQLITLPKIALANPATRDIELPVSITAEGMQIQITGDGAAGTWWQVGKVTPWFKADPWSPVRGAN